MSQTNRLTIGLRLCCFGMVVSSCIANAMADEASSAAGRKIYETQCARCHGEHGEGVEDEQPEPLVGDRALADLTAVIAETMPAEKPEQIIGKDAEAVAAYIYDAFYSPVAQARNKPARVALSRLTVRQYQNTITDLIGSFTGTNKLDDRHGLDAEYFNSRSFRRDKRIIERVDSTVDFDFGEGSPNEKFGKEEFSMNWNGSIIAPETGEYEFIVHTENGARLWVNDREDALIDAWVRSGDDTEFRGSIRLLGGRAYSLRLEFFKFKEKRASIRLLWKPPHGTTEVIPARNLSPSRSRELMIVETPFPPDDKSDGYERGNAVSKSWDEATTFAAIEIANKIVTNIRDISGVSRDDGDRDKKLREFCTRFVERAFRRPLSDTEREIYIDRHFAEARDSITATKRVVLLALKSPRFLFREVEGTNDSFDIAARLSFAMWDSLPDDSLRQAASRNELMNPQHLSRHADRMAQDPRTKAKLREFFHQWLKLEEFDNISKDQALFPDFNAELVSDLRTSLDLMIDEIINSEHADLRQLLLTDGMFVNDRLAKFYGIELESKGEFQHVSVNPQHRAGIVSHPYMMTGFAYHSTSSPIHRGVFLARNLLGRSLNPPQDAVTPIPPELHPDLTTRQRIALQTSPAACALCHKMINPLGFSLENYDAVGRFRDQEKTTAIDASGSYNTLSGDKVDFTGPRQLAEFLANSPEVHAAFVERLFRFATKQPIQAYGPDRREKLSQTFVEHDFNINKLLVEIAKVSATIPTTH